jgi:hypothetical protein
VTTALKSNTARNYTETGEEIARPIHDFKSPASEAAPSRAANATSLPAVTPPQSPTSAPGTAAPAVPVSIGLVPDKTLPHFPKGESYIGEITKDGYPWAAYATDYDIDSNGNGIRPVAEGFSPTYVQAMGSLYALTAALYFQTDAGLLCRDCLLVDEDYMPDTVKPLLMPLPDLDGTTACVECGKHPCRFCGGDLVPEGEKFCSRHSAFCPVCVGGGELGDSNVETPYPCNDCNGKGRVSR